MLLTAISVALTLEELLARRRADSSNEERDDERDLHCCRCCCFRSLVFSVDEKGRMSNVWYVYRLQKDTAAGTIDIPTFTVDLSDARCCRSLFPTGLSYN